MASLFPTWRSPRLVLFLALVFVPGLLVAGEKANRPLRAGEFNPDHQTVEMFQAIDDGQIEVKLVPKDSTNGNVLIENKTDKPLNVKLADAFAGVQVLAQIGGVGGVGGRAGRGGGGFGGGQGLGGGFGGGGFGGGFGGGGMGMMNVAPEKVPNAGAAFLNVAPEKVGQVAVTTVCLEHGKTEPRSNMTYKVVPIAEFTDKAEVHEVCRMLGTGQLNQRAAQVAAWHLQDDMSFQELAAKQIHRANGARLPYFSPLELRAGMQIAAAAKQIAEKRQTEKTDSLSQK